MNGKATDNIFLEKQKAIDEIFFSFHVYSHQRFHFFTAYF